MEWAPFISEGSTVASVVGATSGPAPVDHPEPRIVLGCDVIFIRCGNFHFRPDYAKKPDLARMVCRSMIRRCIHERCLLFTGDFNLAAPQLKEVVHALSSNAVASARA
eukprot:8075544-Lingulodinium_polyedra.AAC.1